jgi:hypothetical protein
MIGRGFDDFEKNLKGAEACPLRGSHIVQVNSTDEPPVLQGLALGGNMEKLLEESCCMMEHLPVERNLSEICVEGKEHLLTEAAYR